ncbi:putative acetyltransferase [Janibacter sp. HTCC2649]|uniref:GNAT family N-acetyltransferase n=1 Tax=Janibacter sp. HTCC2649 TaxID=313589 RepID=UPI00006718DF|nr:GNAT family N-acetyltransferase [Janibacter sp. HTCC2649]EAP98230.1 putative acetyltransferase [Janibacter sp. HTCC2649]
MSRTSRTVIREIAEDDWVEFFPTFTEVIEAGETYAFPVGLSIDEARGWWLESPPGVTVVAVDESGVVLGSAKSGPNRPGRGSHVATASFMVSSAARGHGVGRALGEWVLAWAREQGYAAMQFNAVVETNVAAVALWQDLGFTIIGTVPEAFDSRGHGRVGLHVMHQHL